jgi:DNA-binding transcriptional LysR family regulator
MDWRRIQVFTQICGNKSFTAAAQILGKSQSTLSRDVIQLEKKNWI